MTLEELSTVLKIINDDLEKRVATEPNAICDFITNKSYTVSDLFDKGIVIDDKPEVVVRIMAKQEVSHRFCLTDEEEAMRWCRERIAQSIASNPKFQKYIQFTETDDFFKDVTIVTGKVLIAKHL